MKYFFKELLNAFLLGILIFLVYGVILYLAGNPWHGNEVLVFFAQNQLYSVTLYMVNLYVFKAYRGRFEGEFWTRANVGIGLFVSVMASLVTVFFIRLFLIVVYYKQPLESFLEAERIENYYIPMIISLVASSGYYAVVYWKQKQQHKVNESRRIAGTASAQFDALKNQLDPHFLFNSLNVLASLIEENPVQAQKFTTSLSKVYRYVLEQKSKELVPLDEELKFARTYMNLIKMRFEDSIEISVPEKSSNPEFKVVPLSLQLLLENAVKHNQVTPSKKLHIAIEESGNRLLVKNNIQAKQVIKKSSGVGLVNIRQRYHLLTDNEVRIEDDGQHFKVGIPILTEHRQKNFMPAQEEFIADKRYERARKKVEALKGFYIHLTIYCIMVPVFLYLNYISTSFPWSLFPILGWGWGMIGHAAETFGWNPLFNKKWESRKIEELMEDEDF